MVKILHISDIHWRGISRHDEYVTSFNRLFEMAKIYRPDLIVNTGDTFHTKTQGITPEIIDKLAWIFNSLSEIAPTVSILGNHDGNLTNFSREDILTPIHKAINNPRTKLYKKSGVYTLEEYGIPNVALCVYSVFDPDGWKNVAPKAGYINIALYHGSISGIRMDNGWKLLKGEEEITLFKHYDFVMLGDIHKHQFLSYRKDSNGVEKPWIGYPGSLIQQNFGESKEKGFLTWDINSRDDWDVSWHELPNSSPFLTIDWRGNVAQTLTEAGLEGKDNILKGARYRISSSAIIPQIQTRKLITELKETYHASEVVFKTELSSKIDSIRSGGTKISKKSLAEDPDSIVKLYLDYVKLNDGGYSLTDEELTDVSKTVHGYISKMAKNSENIAARNVTWSISEFWFDNLYGYGKENYINFHDLDSLVGILGPNRIGKSSVFGALMYTLFNTTDRGSVKNAHIINNEKTRGRGKVRFNVGGTDYVVERTSERASIKKKPRTEEELRARLGKANTSVNLWKVDRRPVEDGSFQEVLVSQNGITRDDTDKLIRKLIGTAEDFLLTSFASQGNINRFIDNKATKRKEILNRFLELDIFDKLYSYAKEDYSKLNNVTHRYSMDEWSRMISRTEKDIEKYESELEKLKQRLEPLNDRRDDLKVWIHSHEKEAETVDARAVANIEKYVSQLELSLERNERNLKNSKSDLSKTNTQKKLLERKIGKIDEAGLKEKIQNLESLKEKFAELKKTFVLEENELKTQDSAVKKLSVIPCGDKYPSCHFIRDGHQAKKTIKEQQKLVSELSKGYQAVEKTIGAYTRQKIEEKLSDLYKSRHEVELADKTISSLEYSIGHLVDNTKSFKADLRAAKSKLKKAKRSLNLTKNSEYQKKSEQLEKTEAAINDIIEQRSLAYQNLGGKKQELEKLHSEQLEGKNLIRRLKVAESIQSAFSKNGIPAMVLKTQLPAINLEMQKVLGNMVDFTISLVTDTSANIMDIYITDVKGERLIELGSGMEKTITSIALRAALRNLSSLPRPEILVLDESFGALDENNLQKSLELLSLFRSHFKTMFIITHLTPIKEIADQIIEIKSDGKESKVVA